MRKVGREGVELEVVFAGGNVVLELGALESLC